MSFWLEFSVAGVKKEPDLCKWIDRTNERSSKFIKSEAINGSTNVAAFFQHFSLNSRPAKLKKSAKLKEFLLNSSKILS